MLFGYRLQLFDLAGRIGVSAACRTFGVHARPTTPRSARSTGTVGDAASAGAAPAADADGGEMSRTCRHISEAVQPRRSADVAGHAGHSVGQLARQSLAFH